VVDRPELSGAAADKNSNKQFEAAYITALLESIDEILALYDKSGKI
jgi:hypothetical protein